MNKPIFRIIVILFFLACLAVMRGIEHDFKAFSGGESTLDMRFGYNAAAVYALFARLGTGGRSLYIENLLVDFLFIVCFLFIQNFVLAWVMGKKLLSSSWRYLFLIVYFRSLFDFLENLALLFLLFRFPSEYPGLAASAGIITMVKFAVLAIWAAAIPLSFVLRVAAGCRLGMAKGGLRE